jgi:regulator of protease activity HflC (stomatin/prohibitin superfamily)
MSFSDRYKNSGQGNAFNVRAFIRDALLAVVVLILIFWLWPFYSVPTGSRGVVTQFGRIVRVEQEGLTVLPPWQKLALFSIRAEQANIDKAQGSTSDTQPVEVSLTVRYSIATDRVSEVYEKYTHDGDLSSYVETATHEVFKAVTARYTAPDLIAKRAEVSSDIYTALGNKLSIYGAHVINIDMRNFSFSSSYMAAINEKVTQEQLRQAADNKLKTVESEQKQKVAIAEAEVSAVKATADGDAYATVKNAEAAAAAIRAQGAALVSNPQVLELRRIEVSLAQAQKWNGQLPVNMFANTPMPFLNISGK